MRSGPILAFVLMTVASSALAETSIDYEEIKRILQDLLPQEEAATNFIRPEKRSLPLCASCPAVAAPASGCKTSLAPKFGPIKGESGCVCLKKYECCPATCPSIKDVTCSGKISKKPTCETTSGKKCVFPFIYGKKTYNKCTKVGGVGGKAWCATSVDSSGKYKAWENCSTKCTDESTDESTSEGDFYTEAGTDCCDCPTRTCVACPPPRPESSLACDQCYHYQRRHQQQEVTQCWVAGCKKDKPIVYSDPGCDTKCQTVSTVKDDCDTEKKICVDQPAPLGCTPPEPVKKQCFNAPKKVHLDVYYSKGGVCKRCWKWEVTPKPEQCSQIFSLDDACPAAHKKVLGVTTCNTPRDVCLPCTGFVPVCTQCEEKVAVKDECGFEMDTCIKKTCPSISKWAGQECGPLKIVKDACGCENIDCGNGNAKPCNGGDTCCNTAPGGCGEGEGDCDTDKHCAPGLKCGNDNCKGAGFDSTDDCCYKPSAGCTYEPDVDITGNVITDEFFHADSSRAAHELCKNKCLQDEHCKGFTSVKDPGSYWCNIFDSISTTRSMGGGFYTSGRCFTKGTKCSLVKPIKAAASSIYQHGNSKPQNLLDGKIGNKTKWSYDDCFHTALNNKPWVKFDLGKRMEVCKIVIYNRQDCCSNRLFPLQVTVGDNYNLMQEGKTCTIPTGKPNPVSIDCKQNVGRYVMVRTLKKTVMNICEVKIYAK